MQDWLHTINQYPAWLQAIILAVWTFISEDLTCITAGIWVSRGNLHPATAIIGCTVGIFIGDALLYFMGLIIGRPALQLPIVKRFLPVEKVERGQRWFEEHGLMVVIASRFIPGTRLPTYFAAGLLGSRAKYFLPAAALAIALWTPLIVLAGWYFGEQTEKWVNYSEHNRLLVMLVGPLLLFLLIRLLLKLSDWRLRRKLLSRVKRLTHWEFWPIGALYLPVLAFNFLLFLRYRRLSMPLISNPGIEFSGFVGESKTEILSSFQSHHEFFPKFRLIPAAADVGLRVDQVIAWMAAQEIKFPIILKPDVGQRGSGVKRINDNESLAEYFTNTPIAVQAQEHIPGSYEFGVYYVRDPGQETGRVLGLTGKIFPQIVGDGTSTIETLILKNPSGLGRYHIFLKRFHDELHHVPADGEVLQLVQAGNHCLGTIFMDHSHLLTEALNQKFDEISHAMPGFYIGRYDVKAANLEDFRQGRVFKIMELNGSTGEPSHMYDSKYSLFHGYKCLFTHYAYLWQIGYANYKAGCKPIRFKDLLRALLRYRRMARSHPSGE